MPAVLKVTKAEKVVNPADNTKLLEVEYTLTDGEFNETRKQTFPLGTNLDELKAELTKVVESHNSEKVKTEEEKKADETIAQVSGLEVSVAPDNNTQTQPQDAQAEETTEKPQEEATV